MSIPFHKQTDPSKKAGQVVFANASSDKSFDRMPFIGHSTTGPETEESQIVQKPVNVKSGTEKLTFDEWFQTSLAWESRTSENYELLKVCWNTAQENK